MKRLVIGLCLGVMAVFNMNQAVAQEIDNQLVQRLGALLGPLVYDANGRVAGKYFTAPSGLATLSFASAVLNIEGALIHVRLFTNSANDPTGVHPTSLTWDSGGAAFASNNCSGTPYIPMGLPGTRPLALVRDASGALTAYIGAADFPSTQEARSRLDGGGRCVNMEGSDDQGNTFGVPIKTYPLERTVILNQLYPEPLTVR